MTSSVFPAQFQSLTEGACDLAFLSHTSSFLQLCLFLHLRKQEIFHRITESMKLAGELAQVAKDCVQFSFEYLHGVRLHYLSAQLSCFWAFSQQKSF